MRKEASSLGISLGSFFLRGFLDLDVVRDLRTEGFLLSDLVREVLRT
jgi:hypothetical protein